MALKKRFTSGLGNFMKRSNDDEAPDTVDTPEANAARGVRLFCESGAANSGEEVLHLPTIVESAVASPQAAQAAANQIRKFLSKDNYDRPHMQYNAVMLIRILADNPGQSFTKHLDKQFSDTVKHLLRNGHDPSVAQILRETLDALDREKAFDTNLNTLFAMWRKEKGLMANAAKQFGPRKLNAPAWNGQQPGYGPGGGGSHSNSRTLPPPSELVGRIEEARTSAKLLLQLVQSTPANELLNNDLVKEFSERCMTAQRSIQGYINCDNPAPDDDTMLTLIETNEQLSLAASKHQRAVLQARRLIGASPSPPPNTNNNTAYAPVPVPPPAAPVTTYSEPPQPPPRTEVPSLPPPDLTPVSSLAPSHSPYQDKDTSLPPTLQPGNRSREDENPFADHHSSVYSPVSAATPYPPRQGQEDDDYSHNHGGPRRSSPTYYPGYSSYQAGQDSSANNATGRQLTEEEEYARDYPANDRPHTPERPPRTTRDSEVSPIQDRAPVTYRY